MASGLTVPQTDNQYFYEDEVFRIDKKGRVKFGLVLENSEAFSSDEEDVMDDILSKGEIRIAWHPDGKEDILQERVVGLADRTLMPGDVVRRLVPGKDTQRGYCREINMRADVRIIGTKYVVKNVMAERLRPLVKMPRDNAVCLDSWVGSTKCVNEKIVLKSSCGAILDVPDLDLCHLKDVNTRFRNGLFAETVFYPGQTVTGRIESLDNVKFLTPSIVLKTNKKGKPLERKFVVQSVQIEGVWVHWQCKALSEDNSGLKTGSLQQPKPYVTGEDLERLKRLNLFESCMLQINDKNYLKISDCDVIVRKSQWEKEQAIKYKLLLSQQQKEENQSKNTKVSLIQKQQQSVEKIRIKLTNTTLENEGRKSKSATASSNSVKVVQHNLSNTLISNNSNNSKERNETDKQKEMEKDTKTDLIKVEEESTQQEDGNNTCDEKKSTLTEKSFTSSTDGWQTDEESEEIDIEENSVNESTTTTISTCSSPTPKSSPKRSPLLHKKQVKKLKKKKEILDKMPSIGDEIVTEALVVYSTATVVWQDGTVETGIPSTQLYPIHHLDDHEFFPGDFVLSGVEGADVSYRDYGVIQTVDHQGRTARVKWFTTYTSMDEPRPTYTGESEVSVYDLKDHPDFQYRPGTIVIRVANFVGEDATCTAGQIIDNYVDGRVKVWWVDGHISMCWPQDLFEVGQYDADNNFWGNTESDNDSWETESEVSEPGGSPQLSVSETHLSTNLERARVNMARLEEIFIINPSLQNQEVMRKLLAVYKKCRYLDRLMNTSFFHEDHFDGLLEPVRKGGSQTKAERAQDQKNRLFSQSPSMKLSTTSNVLNQQQQIQSPQNAQQSPIQQQKNAGTNLESVAPKEYAPKVLINLVSTPFKSSSSSTSLKRKPSKLIITTNIAGNNCISSSNNIDEVENALTAVANNKESVDFMNNTLNSDNGELNTAQTVTMKSSNSEENSALGNNTMSNSLNNNKNSVAMPTSVITSSAVNGKSNSCSNTQILAPVATTLPNSSVVNTNATTTISNNTASCTVASSLEPKMSNAYFIRYEDKLISNVMTNIDKATQETEDLNNKMNEKSTNKLHQLANSSSVSTSQEDSGNYSRNENCDGSSTSYASSNDLTNDQGNNYLLNPKDDQKSISCSSIELTDDTPDYLCARLCALLKAQLVKALQEIQQRYGKENLNLSEVVEYDVADEKILEDTSLILATCEEAQVNSSDTGTTPATTAVGTPTIAATVNNIESPSIEEFESSVSTPLIQAVPLECFQVLETAPITHKFHLTIFHPSTPQHYYKAVRREHKLLRSSLPPGVWVKVFEDRMDLLSVMIEGPKKTPYEDGMFFFDIQLPREYPKAPPLCHYISYCSDRLNPNLYEDGKVCVSLLGTWSGRDSEVWGANSTLLQVIVSIQGLILVPEPYFNEAGYEKQKGTQQGKENSRMYNEMVIIKLVQSMTKLLSSPIEVFSDQIMQHFKERGKLMYERIKGWMEISQNPQNEDSSSATSNAAAAADINKNKNIIPPDFPLVPASRGFCLTLAGLLDNFHRKLEAIVE